MYVVNWTLARKVDSVGLKTIITYFIEITPNLHV